MKAQESAADLRQKLRRAQLAADPELAEKCGLLAAKVEMGEMKIAAKQRELEEAGIKIEDCESQLDLAKAVQEQHRAYIRALTERSDMFEHKSKAILDRANKTRSSLALEISAKSFNLKQYQADALDLQDEVRKLRIELFKVGYDLSTARKDLAISEETCREYERSFLAAKGQRDQLGNKAFDLIKDLDSYSKLLRKACSERDSLGLLLREKETSLQDTLAVLESEKSEHKECKTILEEQRREIAELCFQKEGLSKSVSQQESLLQDRQKQIDLLNERLNESNRLFESLSRDFALSKTQSASVLESKLEQFEALMKSMQESFPKSRPIKRKAGSVLDGSLASVKQKRHQSEPPLSVALESPQKCRQYSDTNEDQAINNDNTAERLLPDAIDYSNDLVGIIQSEDEKEQFLFKSSTSSSWVEGENENISNQSHLLDEEEEIKRKEVTADSTKPDSGKGRISRKNEKMERENGLLEEENDTMERESQSEKSIAVEEQNVQNTKILEKDPSTENIGSKGRSRRLPLKGTEGNLKKEPRRKSSRNTAAPTELDTDNQEVEIDNIAEQEKEIQPENASPMPVESVQSNGEEQPEESTTGKGTQQRNDEQTAKPRARRTTRRLRQLDQEEARTLESHANDDEEEQRRDRQTIDSSGEGERKLFKPDAAIKKQKVSLIRDTLRAAGRRDTISLFSSMVDTFKAPTLKQKR